MLILPIFTLREALDRAVPCHIFICPDDGAYSYSTLIISLEIQALTVGGMQCSLPW